MDTGHRLGESGVCPAPPAAASDGCVMTLEITPLTTSAHSALPLEIVERKGLGHPDSICDALAENLSIALSRAYLERFGVIFHHNVDKALLCGGAARPAFGGGQVLEPIEIYLAGRATTVFRGVEIPIETLAIEASRRWLRENLPTLDVVHHVRIYPKLRPTSPDLTTLFARQRQGSSALANDTSFGVGFAPLSDLETTVLGVEESLHAPELKIAHPEIGDDIKVMGIRKGTNVRLTLACPLIDRYVTSYSDYQQKKSNIRELALSRAPALSGQVVSVDMNTADGETPESLYLTVTGLSAEAGDDGQVGRGNRINGLITPYRPMSLEAVAGKNPISHVGKLYNIIAGRMAQALLVEIPEVQEAHCYLVSQIGRPISEPALVDLKVRSDDPRLIQQRSNRIREIASAQLAKVGTLWQELIDRAAAPEDY